MFEKLLHPLFHKTDTVSPVLKGPKNTGPMPPPPVKADTPELQKLSDACALGDEDAMLKLSDYLLAKISKKNTASDMWLLRAAMYGNNAAQKLLKKEMQERSGFLERLCIPYKNFIPGERVSWHTEVGYGCVLNAIGLLTFHPEGLYTLAGINEDRVLIAWKYEDYDSPDDTGFGAETYYDMFCLDEFFNLIPGAPMVHRASTHDLSRTDSDKSKQYEEMCHFAKKALEKREKRPLWMEFETFGK